MNIEFYGKNDNYIYLDNAASTISFKKVKNVADDFLYHYGSLHRGSGINSKKSTDSYENAREKILSFLDGTKEDCVIFTNNTTDSINKFALIYPFEKNDVVLTSDIEHTSNYLPWLKHAKVQLLKTNDFKIEPRNVEKELIENKNIKIIALTWASNITGYISEIKNIYKICKKYNVLLFIDASQYSPHHKPTLKYCDFIAYCGHKMYAPYGSGVLAGNKEILKNDRYSLTGGGNVIYIGENGQVYYKEVPYMHEAGTPNGLGAVTLACAHEVLFKDIGINRLEKHNKDLLNAMKKVGDSLLKHGYDVYFHSETINRTPLLIINNKRKTNKETVYLLNEPVGKSLNKKVFCREGSFCAYNILEKLFPKLKEEIPVIDNKLNPKYSLIRLSGGLTTTVDDIYYTYEKLKAINKI